MIGHDDLIPMADNYFKNIDISGQIGNQIVAMRNGLWNRSENGFWNERALDVTCEKWLSVEIASCNSKVMCMNL